MMIRLRPHLISSSSSINVLSGVIQSRRASASSSSDDHPELRGRIRSEMDIINVAEHRIQRSMEEGEFENLAGKGKPLDLKTNPHADPAEDTLYRILSQNGFGPEWVVLNKEIRQMLCEWKVALNKAWTQHYNSDDGAKWRESSEALQVRLGQINDKVFRYNLIAPFGRQMHGLKWEKELNRLKEEW